MTTFEIIATTGYGEESVDTAETRDEAEYLAGEYRLAFGPGIPIRIVEEDA